MLDGVGFGLNFNVRDFQVIHKCEGAPPTLTRLTAVSFSGKP